MGPKQVSFSFLGFGIWDLAWCCATRQCKDAPPLPPVTRGGRCAPAKASPRCDWPLVWDELLAQRGQPRSCERKAQLPPERRGWAFDLPPAGGATANAPKRWVAADVDAFVDAFVDAYLELGPEARHAYELLEATRGCHLFFDLDGRSDGKFNCEEVASCIAEEAAGVLRDLVVAGAPAHVAAAGVAIRTLTVESAHGGGKFSRHLLLQALGPDEHVAEPRCVLAGLGCAHAVAARVVARVVARCGQSAGSLVDFALPLLSVFRLCVCCLVCVCSCGHHGWCGRDGTWNDSPLYFPIFFT